MAGWLRRALGLGGPTAPQPAPFVEPAPAHVYQEPPYQEPPYDEPALHEPAVAEPLPHEPALVEPSLVEPPSHVPDLVEPTAPALSVAAFALHSLASSRIFARPEDGLLVHVPGDPTPAGGEVHGFVTDSHPGILILMSPGRVIQFSAGEPAVAQACRIEEAGEDAFALKDLSNDHYLSAEQHGAGVNPVANNRGAVQAWEMFHLVAVDGVAMPAALPALLPPAGEPITAETIAAWRVPPA